MLTQHIQESLQVTPGPFPVFFGVGPGGEANLKHGRGSGVLYNISCHMGWGLRCKNCRSTTRTQALWWLRLLQGMVYQSLIRPPSLLGQQKISCSQIGEWPHEKSLGTPDLPHMYDIHFTCEIGGLNIKLKTNFYNHIVSKGNVSNFLPM